MDFYNTKIKMDDYSFSLINIVLRIKFKFSKIPKILKGNIKFKDKHKGKRAFIIMNAPSLAKLDLKPLSNELVFFANRGFMHKDYEYIKPEFHAFVDPKLKSGIWPISFLEECRKKSKDVNFILSADWKNETSFKSYIKDSKILWIFGRLFYTPYFPKKVELTKLSAGVTVIGACISSAIYMGCSEIYLLGFEGTGLLLELLNKPTHFYGENNENNEKERLAYHKDLYMKFRSHRSFLYLSRYCIKNNIKIVNLTEGSMMKEFEEGKLEDIIGV